MAALTNLGVILLAAYVGTAAADLWPSYVSHMFEDTLKVTYYYESLDGASKDVFMNKILPAYEQLGDRIHVDLVPYGLAKSNSSHPWSTDCRRGLQECNANVIQACAAKKVRNQGKLLDFLACTFKVFSPTSDSVEIEHWTQYCSDIVGVNFNAIKSCVYFDGAKVMEEVRQRTFNEGIRSVPIMRIAGQFVNDRCSSNLFQCLCDRFSFKPEVCLPPTTTTAKPEEEEEVAAISPEDRRSQYFY